MTPSKTAAAAADLGSARVLFASSEEEEAQLISSILGQRGYDVVPVGESSMVLQALEDQAIDIILLDGAVEGGSAAAVEAVRSDRRYADVPIILLGHVTGDVEGESMPGIDDRSARPVNPHELLEKIRVALRTRRSLLGMESAHSVVAALANELLAPETDVRLHTERLGTYASQLGRRVGLSASDLNAVAYGTLLHDLAKLGIAEWILLKPGPFTEEERIAMQRHTEIGERIAAPLAGADRFGPILRHHHERWDGQGYPDGLKGEGIPMGARIIGVVDAFDAMTQYRNYRQAKSVPEAVEELQAGGGTQFDPGLVDAFIEVLQWDGLI
ncbi:MAG: HD-GYP domain-containing protein [Chloroflexota bacterium]